MELYQHPLSARSCLGGGALAIRADDIGVRGLAVVNGVDELPTFHASGFDPRSRSLMVSFLSFSFLTFLPCPVFLDVKFLSFLRG